MHPIIQNRPVRFDMTSRLFGITVHPSAPESSDHPSAVCIAPSSAAHPIRPAMLRSRLSPLLLLSTPTSKALLRQSPHRLTLLKSLSSTASKTVPPIKQSPKLSLVIRPPPAKNALQLARVFSTTAVSKEVKATVVKIQLTPFCTMD